MTALTFFGALAAAALLLCAARWVWRSADPTPPPRVQPAGVRIVAAPAPDPALLDWADFDGPGGTAT